MASLVSQPSNWNDNISQLRESLHDSQLRINNVLRSFPYGGRDMRRILCYPIGTTVQEYGQPHEATPIFNFLLYKGHFDIVDRYINLFPVSKFNEPTGVGGLKNGITRENPFHLAARSRNRMIAITKVIDRYSYSVSDRNLLTDALALIDANDIEATPLMTLLAKTLDMWSAIQRSSSGRRVTGVNFNTLQDEYNLIKFFITQNNSGGRFFNVSMMESMADRQNVQDMYDGYRQDFYNIESRFEELTGIEAAMRSKLEDGLYYYSDSRSDGLVDQDGDSDASTQILSDTDNDELDSYDEDDEYFQDNSDYEWNEETEHWEHVGDDEPAWTTPVLSQELHGRIDYAIERRQQDALIQLIRDEGKRILYARRYPNSVSNAPYFSWFVLKGFAEVVTFAIGQLDDGGDLAANDKLIGGATRWTPYHYAADSICFDCMLSLENLLNQNLSVVWYMAAKITSAQGDTPLMILLNRIPNGYEEAMDEQQGDERIELMDDTLNLYDKIKQWMRGEGQRFVQASFNRVTPEVGQKYEDLHNSIEAFEDNIQEYLAPEELIADFHTNPLSELIQYTVQHTAVNAQQPVARNLANELNQVASIPARVGEFYTLAQFRRMAFPIEANRLTFTVPGKDLDCDVGDYETTKYMPVKLDVERTTAARSGEWIARHNWDVDGSGKLYLFCAQNLKGYLTTRQGTYGLSASTADTFFENSFANTNPFNRKRIIGIQYLTQAEIDTEQAKYPQLKSENNNVEDNRKALEKKANEETYADSMKLLATNSMLSILRRRLVKARNLLAEEQAKDTNGMTSRERTVRNEEIVGAQNRILNLEQMIRREEQKEEQKRLEESKRKNSSSDGGSNKRQRRNLWLKLSNLKF